MEYSIIYSCDVPKNTHLAAPPPSQSHLWVCTERDGGPNGGQMDWGVSGIEWSRGRHRKYCAILDQKEFDEFVNHVYIYAEDVETGGSIGAPGFGYCCVPAISFTGNSDDMLQSAYVTPMPDHPGFVSPEAHPAIPGFEDVLEDVLQSESGALWNATREEIIETYA